jgi:hypothetical protein
VKLLFENWRKYINEHEEEPLTDPLAELAEAKLSSPDEDITSKFYIPAITEGMVIAALKALAGFLLPLVIDKIADMIISKGVEIATRYIALKVFERYLDLAIGQGASELSSKGLFFPSIKLLKSNPELVSQLNEKQINEYRSRTENEIMHVASKPFTVDVNKIMKEIMDSQAEKYETPI